MKRVGDTHAPGVIVRRRAARVDVAAAVDQAGRPEHRRQPVNGPALADAAEVDAAAHRHDDAPRRSVQREVTPREMTLRGARRRTAQGRHEVKRSVVAGRDQGSQTGWVEEAAGPLCEVQGEAYEREQRWRCDERAARRALSRLSSLSATKREQRASKARSQRSARCRRLSASGAPLTSSMSLFIARKSRRCSESISGSVGPLSLTFPPFLISMY